jgi:hypothetical protein
MLDRAIAISERCERAFFWRGMLKKRLGKAESAYNDFRRAVDLNPRNIDAAREVRLHQMRRGQGGSVAPPAPMRPSPKPAPPERPSLLGRFFKPPK